MLQEYITGTTSVGKKDLFITFKDPTTNLKLFRIKNPKVPIVHKKSRRTKFIDLAEQIESQEQPNFGFLMQLMKFDHGTEGWAMMGEIIKSKHHHK